MGVEVAGTELPKVNDEVKTKLFDQENGKINFSEVITFGSHGVDELQSTGEANNASNASFPKDAVDEWPEVQTHYFYFAKHRPYEDPSVKAEIEQFEKDIRKKNERINQLFEELRVKKLEKSELYDELNALEDVNSQHWEFINEKREEMKPLQNALGSLRGGGGGDKGSNICSSEDELNQRIRSFEYRMQHETMSLKEEKQLMKEIKELEATRPKVIANSAKRAKILESMGQKEVLQDQVKLLGTDLDGVRKQQAEIKVKRDRLSPQLTVVKKQIEDIKSELDKVKGQKNKAINDVKKLWNSQKDGNAHFNENRIIISQAREIASKKDVKALEELNNAEVEKFMSQWNSSKAFRDDYEKKLLTSLDNRQLSRDGRIRNFDEKPLVRTESPRPSETDVSKATSKQQKEVEKSTLKAETLPEEKVQNVSKKGSKELKTASEPALEDDVFVVEKPKKDVIGIDAEKLKEMKKEEEKEKQRQALERKKKMQDKAAAKAALRIQKEAEKKQKEREKKLRKKEASTVQPTNEEEPTENPETDGLENSDDVEAVVETPSLSKAKIQQANALRLRKSIKTRGTLPKAILKKKKSDKYWLWGSAAAAAVLTVLLLVLGYKYLF